MAAARVSHRCSAVVLVLIMGLVPAVAPGGNRAVGRQDPAPDSTVVPPKGLRAVTPVFSVRRVPDLVRTRAGDLRVAEAADTYRREAGPGSCLTVSDRGRQIVRFNPQQPVTPASVLKTFTATVALSVLGPETRLPTVARTPTPPDASGVVNGDLFLVGGGDPLLFTEGFRSVLEDRDQPQTDFAGLADRIKAAGVTEITGNIVGDESRYDDQRSVVGWEPSYQAQDQVGALSALEVNRGNAGLSEAPDAVARSRRIGDPAPLAARTLRSLLVARGVKVAGTGVAGVAPVGATEVARVESLPVRELVAEMLTWSDNTTAELLTKEIGLRSVGQGTTAAGVEVIHRTLADRGVPMDGVVIFDGSGLHRSNKVTCDAVVAVLGLDGTHGDLAAGFAVAGRSGTLRKRLRNTDAEGRVVAKTGSLKEVYALAGWVDTVPGSELTLVAVVNGDPPEGVSLLDDLAVTLTQYPGTAPGREVVGPKPPA